MEQLSNFVSAASNFVWNSILLYVLVFTGLLFTIRLGVIQFRKFGTGWRAMFGGFSLKGARADKDGMSSFQAAATSIAAQVGTGNIVGCATAILLGGPGAVLWVWIAAFLGMATIYAEAVLAQKYKSRDEKGEVIGGPVYYIRARFQGGFGKFMAAFFAVAIILALGIMGNMVQANSISNAFETAFHVPKFAVGIVLAVLAGFIFMGGVTRIASVTEKLVPIMAICYLIGSLIVILLHITKVPEVLYDIVVGAFSPSAIFGGGVGIGIMQAMRYGVARGLFSNEAGMGSTPHAHAMAKVARPEDQGHIAMVCVFIDTFVVLTLTALVILTTGVVTPDMIGNDSTAASLTQSAFSTVFGHFGNIFVAVCLLFFAFSTIIGWYFFGEQNVKYLFGRKAVKIYAVLVVLCIVVGSMLKVDLVWNLADFFNAVMALPNLIALIALSSVVVKISKDSDVLDHKNQAK
ncbi:sodium:alanine symporter family protein [Pseudoflavonifractor sp. MSJ-37]|uniref:alanine/glycine:cation symporter family protein n=1 Tax=Pseudoflavonifractor sp. MSJ-37 TaxID=2841531 RepID=UPI001C1084C0|nr:sodium:alanine symporter family protein [Pseudoflavonifractor sp. MSJ-37]MBU5435734.1 sodium:alanine symporter family protein [Pseudoflavonifractor sp. MSJ-37]